MLRARLNRGGPVCSGSMLKSWKLITRRNENHRLTVIFTDSETEGAVRVPVVIGHPNGFAGRSSGTGILGLSDFK